MTEHQAEVLNCLELLRDRWSRPMDFGGTDASWHSACARGLVKRGWVEREERRSLAGRRSPYVYRITEMGRWALNNHRLTAGRSARQIAKELQDGDVG